MRKVKTLSRLLRLWQQNTNITDRRRFMHALSVAAVHSNFQFSSGKAKKSPTSFSIFLILFESKQQVRLELTTVGLLF